MAIARLLKAVVLLTPGDMSAWELADAFIPVLLAVIAMFLLVLLPFYAARWLGRRRARRQNRAARK